jgi:hypothetical protein
VSEGTGSGNNTVPAKTESAATSESQTEEWDRIVDEAVDAAFDKEEKRQRQKYAKDIVPPLKLGPQRYTDPAMWGPPEHLRPVIGGSGPDAGKKVPLTQDPHYAKVGELLDELDSILRWPGDD